MGAGFTQMGVRFDEVMERIVILRGQKFVPIVRSSRLQAALKRPINRATTNAMRNFKEDKLSGIQYQGEFPKLLEEIRDQAERTRAHIEATEHRLQAELDRLRQELIREGQRRRELKREVIVGLRFAAVSEIFKDRVDGINQLRRLLSDPTGKLVCITGRGGMGQRTLAALNQHKAVYLHAIGGASRSARFQRAEVQTVYKLSEFGIPEAFWVIRVEDFPAVVTMDSHERSLHEEKAQESEQVRQRLLSA